MGKFSGDLYTFFNQTDSKVKKFLNFRLINNKKCEIKPFFRVYFILLTL